MPAPLALATTSSVSAPPVCALTMSTRTSPEVRMRPASSRVAGGTSCPSSTASLKAAGVAFSRPAAAVRYSGTGSVTNTFWPPTRVLSSSRLVSMPSIPAANVS